MTIVGLKKGSEGESVIDDDLYQLLYSNNETALDKICQTAREKIYSQDLKDGKVSEAFVKQKLESLKHAFASVVHKFQNIPRNTGGDYFEHQLRVAYSILTKSKKPTLRKLLIALHHDSIEDTDYGFSTLEETLDEKVALGVLSISKRPFVYFINKGLNHKSIFLTENQKKEIIDSEILNISGEVLSTEYLERRFCSPPQITKTEKALESLWLSSLSDYYKFSIVKSTGIVNKKGLLSDRYREKKKVAPERITLEERFAEELYCTLKKQYKDVRDAEYFSHMLPYEDAEFIHIVGENTLALNTFYNHVSDLSSKEDLRLTQEELKEISYDSLEVKFFDRLDNLETTEYYKDQSYGNLKKAKDKIEETQKYFYKIALEFDTLMVTDFYSMILFEVEELKKFIKEKELEEAQKQAKGGVDSVLEK